tara:strand:- start:239 stop:448 length:210 start_codon:yes stop_codon:yes gene_type:complete
MLKALVGLPITVKGVLTNIPKDFRWYFIFFKMGVSIVNESHGLKPFTIKQKFVNKLKYIAQNVKKNLMF